MNLMPWKKSKPGLVGVEITDRGIAFAYVDHNDQGTAVLKHCEMLMADGQLPQQQFRERIEALGLTGMSGNVVLPAGSYQLLLVEAPNVPDDEMSDAVRFRIKDMISFPVNEALVDVFALPADSSRSGRRMVYAVVTQQSRVREIMALMESVKLTLEYIDISELALRNITENLKSGQRGLAVVRLIQGQGTLTLMRNGQLYLSRQFELDYNAGLFDELPEDQLILELQRSLDYYERQMGQVPPSDIFLCGENVTSDKVSESLNSGVAADISALELSQSVELGCDVDESLLQLCVSAVGGALRQRVAA